MYRPLCDAFLNRTVELLADKESALPKIHYGLLTLKLLAEKNDAALHHLTLAVTRRSSKFLVTAFEVLLRGKVCNICAGLAIESPKNKRFFCIIAIRVQAGDEVTIGVQKCVIYQGLTKPPEHVIVAAVEYTMVQILEFFPHCRS